MSENSIVTVRNQVMNRIGQNEKSFFELLRDSVIDLRVDNVLNAVDKLWIILLIGILFHAVDRGLIFAIVFALWCLSIPITKGFLRNFICPRKREPRHVEDQNTADR